MAIKFELLNDEEIVAEIGKWKKAGIKRGVAIRKAQADWKLNSDEDLALVSEYIDEVYENCND